MLLLLLCQFLFNNGLLLFCGFSLFYFLFYNIQQPFKPSVFTVILFYHFLQITAAIWQSNYMDEELTWRSPEQLTAIILSYVGLAIMFLPMIYFQNKLPALNDKIFRKHAEKLSTDKAMRLYVISFFGFNALVGVAYFVPALIQLIYSLANVKWIFFLVFALLAVIKKERMNLLIIFSLFEFMLGFFSYFSEFKTIIFFLLFVGLIFLRTVNFNKVIVLIISLFALFYAGLFWTSIKDEYREFLNQGSKSQTVQVDESAALDKLTSLSQSKDAAALDGAAENFMDRLQYTYHFAKTIERVPAIIPYQEGKNWLKTLKFVLTPRLIDPNKGSYDASTKTTQYTGISYSNAARGTSVSLGYFVDCYIDFGYLGMMIPLLLIGYLFGSTYYYFMKSSSNNYIFNIAVVGALYMEFFAFESDNIFFIGRLYIDLVVFLLLRIFVFPQLMFFLRASSEKDIVHYKAG